MKTKTVARHCCWLLLPLLLLLAGCADKKKQAAEFLQSAGNSMQSGNYAAAIADYTKAIELMPDDGSIYSDRGAAKILKSDFAGAITDCSKAIALQPENYVAYSNRATAEQATGDTVSALVDFSKVIAIHPVPADYEQRGLLRHLLGDFSGAVEDYEKSSSLPEGPLLQLRSFALLRRLGRDPGDLAQAITNIKDPWLNSIARYLTGQMNEADFLAAADQGKPADVAAQQCQANYFVGMTHLANHDPAGARKFFSTSASLNETQADEYEFARAELALLDKTPPQSASPALNSLMDRSPYGERYDGPQSPPR